MTCRSPVRTVPRLHIDPRAGLANQSSSNVPVRSFSAILAIVLSDDDGDDADDDGDADADADNDNDNDNDSDFGVRSARAPAAVRVALKAWQDTQQRLTTAVSLFMDHRSASTPSVLARPIPPSPDFAGDREAGRLLRPRKGKVPHLLPVPPRTRTFRRSFVTASSVWLEEDPCLPQRVAHTLPGQFLVELYHSRPPTPSTPSFHTDDEVKAAPYRLMETWAASS
ncbi:hypothetical protein AYL99_11742 [Fonsecaea erecta]|uniref:Uncharacterized protein n=1 Tax=Fonsecaea erecta TaxID=1367422 RepID=A0A178Z3A3_9EURO|nr:hypothetical protein AYL99_11742 [Fonsecaea erecta]OAP54207.1 hypothetical protein AYL99_11742 [Fonsecaea erecta]